MISSGQGNLLAAFCYEDSADTNWTGSSLTEESVGEFPQRHLPDIIRCLHMQQLTFILASPSAHYRHLLSELVEACPGWSIIDETNNGEEAVQLALRSNPDVVLLDVTLPGTNGIEATRHIKAKAPGIYIIILSDYPDEEFRQMSLLAGANGYLDKEDLDADKLAELVLSLCPP